MKREYVTPSAYFEMFAPNQFAGGCTPGISEDGLTKIPSSCYNSTNPNSRRYYNLASTSRCSASRESSTGCNGSNNSVSLITNKANCNIRFDDQSSNLQIQYVSYKLNNESQWGDVQPVYTWSNGSWRGGTHSLPVSSVNFPTDDQGRPYYFNS